MRLVLAVVFAAAATTAGGEDTVSEATFLAAAEGLASRTFVEDVARAEAARGRAGLLANPRLEAGREQPDDNPRQTTWSLSWSPPLDGRRGLSIDAADAGLRADQARLDAERLFLRRGLRTTYAAWALAVARAERLGPLARSVRAAAEKARRRADTGEMSGLAARRLELASAGLEAELARAEAEALCTGAAARGYWPELPPEGRPSLPPLPPPPATGLDGTGRRDVEALAEEARRAGFEARLARRWLPGPELYGGWQTLSLAGTRVGGPVFGVNWTVPLFDRAQAARAEAALRRDALVRVEAASPAEAERARAEAEGLEARLGAARQDQDTAQAARTGAASKAGLVVRAPFAGRIAEVLASPGQSVEAGAPLARLVRSRPVWVDLAARPGDAKRLRSLSGRHLPRPGDAEPVFVPAADARLVSLAPELDPRTATRSVLFELDRDADDWPFGTALEVEAVVAGGEKGTLLPASALVDDAGTAVVYEQRSGEAFARREVRVSSRLGPDVLVTGIPVGVRVVTRGADAVRRASLLGRTRGARPLRPPCSTRSSAPRSVTAGRSSARRSSCSAWASRSRSACRSTCSPT